MLQIYGMQRVLKYFEREAKVVFTYPFRWWCNKYNSKSKIQLFLIVVCLLVYLVFAGNIIFNGFLNVCHLLNITVEVLNIIATIISIFITDLVLDLILKIIETKDSFWKLKNLFRRCEKSISKRKLWLKHWIKKQINLINFNLICLTDLQHEKI